MLSFPFYQVAEDWLNILAKLSVNSVQLCDGYHDRITGLATKSWVQFSAVSVSQNISYSV